ncbi:hypothetical protein N7489_010168 [Penicillium chrysogenum]|jgi:hypothetical protein|uniref:Uncharacterized protein n=1 Tax=Penicillium chrysogenum TaxID=5076 RepID=A0ABQ8WUE8_PENCH|nr:uncharacterized protein N7489_010168 [Penicillium chrysogenum]KAJ5229460.1 hypothetical protein N7489_010168 [Penicillium chrysogenum]KAJ5258865.1 hypothetical protein N7524_010421 [Penicillium chrysogenum]KAJ5282657.1 hypothetical protein N7505_000637 [Penicillium chrysogenum]KAJ6169336.1 hypothetical protein N7497_002179 [Penicillium chrysogenum]
MSSGSQCHDRIVRQETLPSLPVSMTRGGLVNKVDSLRATASYDVEGGGVWLGDLIRTRLASEPCKLK